MSSTPPILVPCPQCGAEMPEGADLCSQCGEALQKVPPEVPAGLRERAVAVACYLTPLPAILFLYLKSYRHSVFVRFHAFQSIILGVAVLVLISVGTLLANIGWTVAWLMFGLLFCVGLFFLWLVLSIKAAQGIRFQLPVLGSEAAKRAVR